MASLSHDSNGTWRIQFVGADRQRRAVRLGKMPQKMAESVQSKVGSLAAASIARTPWDSDTAAWVGKLKDVLYGKLAAVGLVPPREPAPASRPVMLGDFLEQYIQGRTDVKRLTHTNLDQARKYLVGYFGAARPLDSISPGDADDFRRHLLTWLADNTVRRRCGIAKQFFRAAVRKRLISENPFGDMKGCTVRANPSRFYFVTRAEAERVLDACPDVEWRLLFALSRWGGLRCPSEHLGLRWADVDWDGAG